MVLPLPLMVSVALVSKKLAKFCTVEPCALPAKEKLALMLIMSSEPKLVMAVTKSLSLDTSKVAALADALTKTSNSKESKPIVIRCSKRTTTNLFTLNTPTPLNDRKFNRFWSPGSIAPGRATVKVRGRFGARGQVRRLDWTSGGSPSPRKEGRWGLRCGGPGELSETALCLGKWAA